MTVEETLNYFMTDSAALNLWHPAYDVAIKALEKQIPKKPSTEFNYEDDDYFCPDCGFGVTEEHNDFCGSCGQHIDWSEE